MTIRELRILAGMSQKEFAEYFGISKGTILGWDHNRRECSQYLIDLMQYKLEKEGIIKKQE